jgi:hypothetical protein
MLYFLPQHPILATRLLAWLIKANGIFMSLTFAMIELLINATAVTKKLSRKRDAAWSIAKSTKKVVQPSFSLSQPVLF